MPDENKDRLPEGIDGTEHARQHLSSAQTLLTISFISAPVSLLIGGVALSLVAFICALVALSKIRSALACSTEMNALAFRLRTQARIALFASGFATGLNIAYLIVMMPTLIEYLQTGDAQLLSNPLGGGAQDGSSQGSIWG